MKAKIEFEKEIHEVKNEWAVIGESSNGNLGISTKEFDVHISPTHVGIRYVIHRHHDHNNSPYISFKIPEGGVHENRENAELRVQDSSGHLSLDMFYDNYVWKRDLHLIVKEQYLDYLRAMYRQSGIAWLEKEIGLDGGE